jgi:uncharacterized protein (DUF362 family)
MISSDCVYIHRVSLDGQEPGFDVYRNIACTALNAIDLQLPSDGTILLKPNATVLFPPERRIITHPGFLAGMIDALVERGVAPERLLVAEGQSGENPNSGHTWIRAGYTAALESRCVPLRSLNGVETRPVDVPGGVVYQSYPIARAVTDCAFFFNVPLAKCHNLCCTTLSIKNLMGILTSPVRHLCNEQEVDQPFLNDLWRLTETGMSLFENRFYHKLCDLVAALRSLRIPRLCVIDGVVGRDGTGFNEGTNYPLGWTLIGENEVHVDTIGTYLMGLDPLCTPYLKFAAERGLGTNNVDDIEIVDLTTGKACDRSVLTTLRSSIPLMPIARSHDGYYPRFRADGSVVPWNLDRVNHQRQADGLEVIAV